MTTRELVNSPTAKLVVYAIALGIAWATLRAEVAEKADKADVQAMAADIRDIRAILCRATPTDSFCARR
jgi:hypothetical protein